MRVGIIAANNIRYSPYIFFYTDILKQIHVEYELIIADRYGLTETFDGVLHVLPWNQRQNTIVNYVKYTSSVKKIIKKRGYDALIVLTSVNAVFLSLWLTCHYKGKYIVDIRDYSHENIYPYYYLEKIAVQNSLMNVISSRKFMDFLPKSEYSVCHNYGDHDSSYTHIRGHKDQISIGYVGGVSYVDQCKKLMKLVAKDERFLFDFYGTSTKEMLIREAAREISCDRIVFHGAYTAQEKEGILGKVDILFNVYGNGVPLLDCALSNKLYDSLQHCKPILVSCGTYMEEMSGKLGFPLDLDHETNLDALWEWYQSLDWIALERYADLMLQSITRENAETQFLLLERLQKLMDA